MASRLLSPGRASPGARRRHASEMSNPEFALYMEKEHLRGAEEDDYLIMENLIQRRFALAKLWSFIRTLFENFSKSTGPNGPELSANLSLVKLFGTPFSGLDSVKPFERYKRFTYIHTYTHAHTHTHARKHIQTYGHHLRYEEEEVGEGEEVSGISISVCINAADQPAPAPAPATSSTPSAAPAQLLTVSDRRLIHQRQSLRRASAIDSRELPSPLQPLLGDDACGEVLLPVPRQPSGETNASSDLSLSHMVSESMPPRPSIVLDSSQLPRQRSAEQPPPPAPPAPARPETMC
ncbi:hypothetical protein EVAR_65001_1 [Eumeta japonica]|uniref:Uncharacterized protein n=1 Tax=Eumeta variegata TaxID=151549 RepID=A0A4C1SBD6_EUMVA|nr:hypothetical protein EVAR_65001_1 [Eumeta japonica]